MVALKAPLMVVKMVVMKADVMVVMMADVMVE
jgi:hypothetical protein